MIEPNKRIEALHQEKYNKLKKEALCKLTTSCTRDGVVQERLYMKRIENSYYKTQ